MRQVPDRDPALVVTTGLSKNLALEGWRLGVARLAGGAGPAPQAAFYLYPDFSPLADVLLERHGITSDESLAAVLLHKYGVGVLPGSSFGDESGRLRLRVATAMLYGDTDTERHAALSSADPARCPGSPRRWPGWKRSWPTSPADPCVPMARVMPECAVVRLRGPAGH